MYGLFSTIQNKNGSLSLSESFAKNQIACSVRLVLCELRLRSKPRSMSSRLHYLLCSLLFCNLFPERIFLFPNIFSLQIFLIKNQTFWGKHLRTTFFSHVISFCGNIFSEKKINFPFLLTIFQLISFCLSTKNCVCALCCPSLFGDSEFLFEVFSQNNTNFFTPFFKKKNLFMFLDVIFFQKMCLSLKNIPLPVFFLFCFPFFVDSCLFCG